MVGRWPGRILATACAGLIGAATVPYWGDSSRPEAPPAPVAVFVPPRPASTAFGWRLAAAMSAHRALVLEVETNRPGDALVIARQLTELYEDRFDEVLVFFFDPGDHPRRASVRVQWTRTHGYRTLALR